MFELSHLRCFVAVAAEMNFHRAAERLNMTQPPLSRQIQLLERAIGVLLFDRSGRNIRLTSAGRRFLVEAEDLMRRAEEAALSARAAEAGIEGTITLGFFPIAALGPLPAITGHLKAEMPDVRIVLREMLTIHQVEALSSGRHDLGVVRMPRNRYDIRLQRIFTEGYLLAMPRSHPFVERDDLTLGDLDGQDFLMYAPSDGWYQYDIFNGLFAANRVKPNFVQHFGQTLTMLSLVNTGAGLALVPESAAGLGFRDVVYRAIALPADARSDYFLAWNPARAEQPAVGRALELLLDRFRCD